MFSFSNGYVVFLMITRLVLSRSSPLPQDKCVNLRLDDSQRIYLTGGGEKGETGQQGPPGKVGPRGHTGKIGIIGSAGPKGEKDSKGDDSGIDELRQRLTTAENLIADLVTFRENITKKVERLSNYSLSCKDALERVIHMMVSIGYNHHMLRNHFRY